MYQDHILKDPAFADLNDQKRAFLAEFLNAYPAGSSPQAMLSAIMNFQQKANNQGIRFQKSETDVLIETLMQSLPARDRARARLLLSMMNRSR